ncbi:MAG: flagellar basal body rod protein FlgB [Clostridiales bacterium]|jgi:flagellar basal-body rod protein FlgB|nr:flagellar basal body rod protein FlgB [Clostridiales bacterium]
MLESLYRNEDIVGLAMQASALRNSVISVNIANVDTPMFKKSAVSFERSLQRALEDGAGAGKVDLSKVKMEVEKVYEVNQYRLDGNNVDMESEMVSLYKNSAKYDALASCIINMNKRINLVVSGR